MKLKRLHLFLLTASAIGYTGSLSAQSSVSIVTTGDTYTRNNTTETAHGSENSFQAKNGAIDALSDSYTRRAYLKFPTSGIDPTRAILKAEIQLRLYNRYSNNAAMAIVVSPITNQTTNFDEATLVWNTPQPTIGTSISTLYNSSITSSNIATGNSTSATTAPTTAAAAASSSATVSLDITQYIVGLANVYPTNLTFALQGGNNSTVSGYTSTNNGNATFFFLSKEWVDENSASHLEYQPTLVITYETTTPVSFSPLNVAKKGEAALISWNTLSETNTSKFQVEKSTDGINYTTIGEVAAAGNSSSTLSYSFEDKSPAAGKSYYKVVELGLDGKSVSSNIATFEYSNSKIATVYPNPVAAGTDITIALNGSTAKSLKLINAAGQTIKTQTISSGSTSTTVTTTGLSKGLYFIVIDGTSYKVVVK